MVFSDDVKPHSASIEDNNDDIFNIPPYVTIHVVNCSEQVENALKILKSDLQQYRVIIIIILLIV